MPSTSMTAPLIPVEMAPPARTDLTAIPASVKLDTQVRKITIIQASKFKIVFFSLSKT